jgi:ATP-dependent helicase HrpB
VSELGRTLGRLPVHPRLGRLLLEGRRLGCPERAALAAALLAERDPFTRRLDRPVRDPRRHTTASDVLDRVEALEEHERSGRTDFAVGTLHRGSARFVLQARDQLLRSLREVVGGSGRAGDGGEAQMRRCWRIPTASHGGEKGSPRGVLVGGRGVRLARAAPLPRPSCSCVST